MRVQMTADQLRDLHQLAERNGTLPQWSVVALQFAQAAESAYLAEHARVADLLALAKQYASECSECGGSGISVSDVDGDEGNCLDCADIRAAIAKALGA